MEFCNECNNLLLIRQYNNNNLEKKLIYYCNQCNFEKKCDEICIYKKVYKNNDKNNLLNKHQIHNNTLPSAKIKCPECKKINNNNYIILYKNNSFKINYICKKCCFSWIKK